MGGRRRIRGISLTSKGESGLMRPVARIAQSVEQGIENPRVLGSIPSPGTTNLENPSTRRVFAFGEPDSPSNCVRFTRRIPATRPAGSAMRCAKTLPAFLSGPGTTNLKNPPIRRVFAFGEPDSSSNCVRFTRRIPATRPAGSAMRCAKTLPAFLSGPGTTNLEKPAYGLVFCFWRAGLFIGLRSIHSSHPCDSH